jgi:hypothetical protein
MPSDGMPHADGTRVVETPAGIGFGLAVSQGAKETGCVLGGATNFIGLTVRDITLVRSPIDPLASGLAPLDVYPQYSNAGIRSRGHIWVMAGADVNPGDPLFYSAGSGVFGATGGVSGIGSLTFAGQPAVGDTITIQGSAVSFVASGATGLQSNIGATLGDTVANLAKVLNASADANLVLLAYAADPPTPVGGGSGANKILVASKLPGVAGNAYTLATNSSVVTLSGATLSGGVATGVAVPSGFWLSAAIAGQLAKVSLAIQR